MITNRRRQPLDWKLIVGLAASAGVAYAALTIYGVIAGWESLIALGMLAVVNGAAAAWLRHRIAAHGLILGFLTGIFAIELQALFLPLYFQHNPTYLAIEIPFGLSARAATALGAPIPSLIAAVISVVMISLFSYGRRRFSGAEKDIDDAE